LRRAIAQPLRSVFSDPAEGDAGGVVNGDVDELSPDTAGVALGGAVTGNAATCAAELAEHFDVDMNQFAGLLQRTRSLHSRSNRSNTMTKQLGV
jgi:hypothetical protein